MEDLFDSLIYIIIALVGFIISALGKKKKKNARRVSTSNSQEPTQKKERPLISNLEQLLNEELGISEDKYESDVRSEEVREEEAQPILDSPVSEIDNTKNVLDSVPEEMLDDKEDTPYSIEYDENSEIFSKSIKDKENVLHEDEDAAADFDLEEAIIHSEIINRKY